MKEPRTKKDFIQSESSKLSLQKEEKGRDVLLSDVIYVVVSFYRSMFSPSKGSPKTTVGMFACNVIDLMSTLNFFLHRSVHVHFKPLDKKDVF